MKPSEAHIVIKLLWTRIKLVTGARDCSQWRKTYCGSLACVIPIIALLELPNEDVGDK